jgi:hypothetical protein
MTEDIFSATQTCTSIHQGMETFEASLGSIFMDVDTAKMIRETHLARARESSDTIASLSEKIKAHGEIQSRCVNLADKIYTRKMNANKITAQHDQHRKELAG